MAVLGGGANYNDSKKGAVFFSCSCSMILQMAFHLTQIQISPITTFVYINARVR
jgi:hypothetical protein